MFSRDIVYNLQESRVSPCRFLHLSGYISIIFETGLLESELFKYRRRNGFIACSYSIYLFEEQTIRKT